MPIIKSAMKRVRQQEKRRARNNATKRRIKAATKTTLDNVAAKNVKTAGQELAKAISMLDKAVKKGVLHKNTAARRKSKLTLSYNSVSKEAYGTTPAVKKAAPAKKPAAKATKPAVGSKTVKKTPTKPKTTKK
jgi:small subunit ribosomal protein S20